MVNRVYQSFFTLSEEQIDAFVMVRASGATIAPTGMEPRVFLKYFVISYYILYCLLHVKVS